MHRLGQPLGGDAIPYPFEDESGARIEVVRRAREFVERVRRWFPAWDPPPFSPGLYAEMLGIPVIESDELENWDALYVPVDEAPRIILNARVRSRGRRNFSLAHEIAHSWFEDPGGVQFFHRVRNHDRHNLDADTQSLERLCDVGASELLMPRDWFLAALERRGLTAPSIPALASDFQVSLEAAALRATEVSEEPCAVVLVEAGAAGAARVRRSFASERLPVRLRWGSPVAADSLLHRAVARADACEGSEEFLLGKVMERLRVSACGVPRGDGRPVPGFGVAVLTRG